jgi:hypothetical protein
VIFGNPKGFYIIGLTFTTIIGYIISRTFLNGPAKLPELFYVMYLLFFISLVWADAMSARFHIENDDISKTKKYSFFFENKQGDNFSLKDESLVLLAANTNYYFLYDTKDRKTYIIPLKKVIAIEAPPLVKQQNKAD